MPPDDVLEDLPDVLGLLQRAEHRIHRAGADVVAALDELHELADDDLSLLYALLVTFECQPVAAQMDRAMQALAQRVEHTVVDTRKLGGDIVGD